MWEPSVLCGKYRAHTKSPSAARAKWTLDLSQHSSLEGRLSSGSRMTTLPSESWPFKTRWGINFTQHRFCLWRCRPFLRERQFAQATQDPVDVISRLKDSDTLIHPNVRSCLAIPVVENALELKGRIHKYQTILVDCHSRTGSPTTESRSTANPTHKSRACTRARPWLAL
jgi:hypothetical protein